MLDFKLNLYYEKYKDTCIIYYTKFKALFEKDNGKFIYFNELFNMIKDYQIKKYGSLLPDGKDTNTGYIKKGTYEQRERSRYVYRYGNKRERLKRKLEDSRK